MDKIVMIAIVVAVIAIVGVGMMLIQPAPTKKPTTPIVTEPVDEEPEEDMPRVRPPPAINYTNASYGVQLNEVEGNCKLYKHVAKEEYTCFGTAGNYSTMAINEYRVAESETYFCKPTIYGCRLYEKVYIQPI